MRKWSIEPFAHLRQFIGYNPGVGAHLYLKLDTILLKNHIIRVIFQDQAMYVRIYFRSANSFKITKKGVFLSFLQIKDKAWWKN